MQRFFFSSYHLGGNITISEVAFVHQISRVLRSHIGDNVILFDGNGEEYIYCITSIDKKSVNLSFVKNYKNTSDSKIELRLYQALPNKYEKIEYILQKGVEVGISEFVFFRSERSQSLVINERKTERFREIIREATEQCFGNKIAKISFLEGEMPIPESGVSYIFHTEDIESKPIRDIPTDTSSINLFVGPEGGWSSKELIHFQENNIQKIHLGERILRTETTGAVATFFLLNK